MARKIIKLSENDIEKLVRKIIKEDEERGGRYMFFQNLKQMKRQCEYLLNMDESKLESILDDGHDWAQDHIAEAKNNMDQVFDFIMNEVKGSNSTINHTNQNIDMLEEKKKDDRCTRIAKRKYDVWPSAYASGAVVRCRKGEIWQDEK
jgi:vacuolar-type H+-ATPase subunit H